ncbi:MAG: SpoIIE family protein phosphatase [Agathobacter sp.]|nr:SpoIIE family protein phosphatase [Agathobacter sp.]
MGREMIRGIVAFASGGLLAFSMIVFLQYLVGLISRAHIYVRLNKKSDGNVVIPRKEPHNQKMESFAYAVNGLSDAFLVMSQPKQKQITEEVGILEQEITGKLCANCDGCAVCWNENRMRSLGGIRALLHAVMNHSSKEELLVDPYVKNCHQYKGMVEEALQAFGRLELNHAWYNRLQENRYVIAQQLDAMAGLVEEWARARTNIDQKSKLLLSQIIYQVQEKGLLIEDLHLYEENKRLCVEGYVYCKWNGGIPVKHYLAAVEKALHKPMRMGKDTKTILTQEPVFLSLYEDTKYYGLQGIATEKKTGSFINGDSFSFFAMDDGNYHICLSDGMGSGVRANQESEMVVDLLQKFMEAGFRKEIAIKLMNSAMVLQGEENSFSTLDYAMIDLYTGQLELIKIGGAATFIKRKDQVEMICEGTLPAGADAHIEVESVKKQLGNGDFLVMVTDGVIEYLQEKEPEETLAEIIREVKTDNAGVLAEKILEQVMIRTGGHAMDDMTVLVTGIWEK